jgi:hypothetical protein
MFQRKVCFESFLPGFQAVSEFSDIKKAIWHQFLPPEQNGGNVPLCLYVSRQRPPSTSDSSCIASALQVCSGHDRTRWDNDVEKRPRHEDSNAVLAPRP